ncbi:hypothetical protein TrVFT333_001402 [Trichoderma virens FT-333]|nr:hypothetical protein TrVFT333_001402 [Trichoderma virens FT-333]
MATSKAAYLAGKVIGHNNAITKQDVSGYLYSEDTDVPNAQVLEDTDVILKVTVPPSAGWTYISIMVQWLKLPTATFWDMNSAASERASEIIFVDTEPRLTFMKQRFSTEHNDKLALIDYKTLPHGIASKETVVSKLKDICDGRGPAAAFECAAG